MSDHRKRDDYTKDRLGWLDQVAADPELPASAFKVAFAIATSLWRNKGTVTLMTPETTATDQVREAWIGTREIADKIAMSRFTVMSAVDRRRRRQAQGQAKAKAEGRYRGRTEDVKRNEGIGHMIAAGQTWSSIQAATGCSRATIAKIAKRLKPAAA